MSVPRWLIVLMGIAICATLPQAAFAETCFPSALEEFLERPALIFEGSVQKLVERDNYYVLTYKIDVLYKGIVGAETVDVASHCGWNGCLTNPTFYSRRSIVSAESSGPQIQKLAPFVAGECMDVFANNSPLDYLRYLDRYRVALLDAYRLA